jgi:hypothetical protein
MAVPLAARRESASENLFAFKDAFNISLAMQNPNDAEGVFIHNVVNPDGLKSRNRPGVEIFKMRVGGTIVRTHKGMLKQ